jgi:hypothetical protein
VDSGSDAPFTSDERAEISGAVVGACDESQDEFHMQIGFVAEVPRVEAEVRTDEGGQEFHDVPFAGMDKETESIFIHEAKLDTEASEAVSGEKTTFACSDAPYAGFRMYDAEGGIMGCYFGEFVADQFDQTGCPTD